MARRPHHEEDGMNGKRHQYKVQVVWTGNEGDGTASFRGYRRDHDLRAAGKPPIFGSSDPGFRGDPARWNPEELLVASLSACHKLWYLGLCAQAGIVVTAYEDEAEGIMVEESSGAGQFIAVTLRPRVTITRQASLDTARNLHAKAHEMCFIARSVNFPVACQALVTATE
jgi:organic hydroperoxide reductase OsmC/OhrA